MLRESPELWQRPPPDAADDTQCVLDESTGTGSGPGPGSGGGPGSGVGAVHPTTVRTAPSTVVAGRAIVGVSRSPPLSPSVPSGPGRPVSGSICPPSTRISTSKRSRAASQSNSAQSKVTWDSVQLPEPASREFDWVPSTVQKMPPSALRYSPMKP